MTTGLRLVRLAAVPAILLLALPVVGATQQAQRSQRGRNGGSEYTALVQRARARQDDGYDISAVMPFLKYARHAARHGDKELLPRVLRRANEVLAGLPTPPPTPKGESTLLVDATHPQKPIPHLAGGIVVQDFYDDPRLERFYREIGPGLIQIKLFLSELDSRRSNYMYLDNPVQWKEWIRRTHRDGGHVMLHLRNVPSRLTQLPEVNDKRYTGKAPLSEKGREEWKTIVREIMAFFHEDPETHIDYLQAIGEPNIGTNWYNPADPTNDRPENAAEFAEHFRDTVEAARGVDPRVKVGGPSIAYWANDTAWWDGFLGTLAGDKVPFGFVSVHNYDANFGTWDRGSDLARSKMRQYGFGELELVMTEWNLNIGTRSLSAKIRASHLAASHAVVGFMRQLDTGMTQTYFYLGPGRLAQRRNRGLEARAPAALLFLRDGKTVANTAYNAFRMFAMLRDARRLPVKTNDPRITAVAGLREGEVQLLLTCFEPLVRDFDDPALPYREPAWSRTRKVDVELTNLPFESYIVETYRIDREHSNVHTKGDSGADLEIVATASGEGGVFRSRIELPLYGVQLLRLTPRAEAEISTP